MDREEVRVWADTCPTEKTPATWGLNKRILTAIDNIQNPPKAVRSDSDKGPFFCFGTDIDFDMDSIRPKDSVSEIQRKFIAALDAYEREGGDATWIAQRRFDLVHSFSEEEAYFAMLELHGLKKPDGDWLVKGELSDVTEYRYGRETYGIGWHDEAHKLEVRTPPLEPLEFIAAYNKIMHALKERGADTGHIHLHVSAWEGGRPFASGARNIFENETDGDLENSKAAVAALSYAGGLGVSAYPLRGAAIRTPKGRIELRNIEQEAEQQHMACTVLETMCNVRYGFDHHDDKEFPVITTAWRPHFNIPEHPQLQMALNQATVVYEGAALTAGSCERMMNLEEAFRLAFLACPIDCLRDVPLCDNHRVYATRTDGGRVRINLAPIQYEEEDLSGTQEEIGEKKEMLEALRQAAEKMLNDSNPLAFTTISTVGIPGTVENTDPLHFEKTKAYQEWMPAELRLHIANAIRRYHSIPVMPVGAVLTT